MSHRHRSLIAAVLVTAIGAFQAGCASRDPTMPSKLVPVPPDSALRALPRECTAAERGVLAAANTFSFDLWHAINDSSRGANIFVSPLSVSFALGMTLNGANGPTYDEMRSALRFGGASLTSIDSGYMSLIALLRGLDPSTTMQIANAIFYRAGFPFKQSFLGDASTFFGAQVAADNFDDQTATLSAVNGWANDETHGRIPSVLDRVDPAAVMYLLNAIYFKGTWRTRFDSTLTQSAPFHASNGDQTARLMHRAGNIPYAETNTFQAVDLPYGDSAFTMTVLLPKPGISVESVAGGLTPEGWQPLTADFHARDIDLYLPKFSMSWKRGLIPDMQTLGMRLAFTDTADFTGMSPLGRQLLISLLQQNSFVTVDEAGTEAGAVTTVGISVTSVQVPTVMRVDRPFVFVIRERLSGTVLFMGKIVQMPPT